MAEGREQGGNEMSIVTIAIIAGVVIVLALIAWAIFARPRVQDRRRAKAGEIQRRADDRHVRAEQEHAKAAEQEAQARREAAEARERRRHADSEIASAGKEMRKAERLHPDR